jgi:hypothetical protein
MRSEIAKKHSSEAFYALDDSFETAVYSVLLELVKEMYKADCKNYENWVKIALFPQS